MKRYVLDKLPDIAMALFTFGVLLVTFFYTRYAGQQLKTMIDQSADLHRQTVTAIAQSKDLHKQTQAAIDSANAAKAAATVASQSLQDERKNARESATQFSEQLSRLDRNIAAQVRLGQAQSFANRLGKANLAEERLQLAATEKQAIYEQRPWVLVSVEPLRDDRPSATIYRLVGTSAFQNFGKSPAIDVETFTSMTIGPLAMQCANRFFTRQPCSQSEIRSHSVLAPSSSSPPSIYQSVELSANSDGLFKAAMEADLWVTMSGRVRYTDLTGHSYETDYCFARLATGAFEYCLEHNTMK